MNLYKIHLCNRNVDWLYKRMIEILVEFSNLEEFNIVDRKEDWNEYEVFEDHEYIIECELTEKEYAHLLKNFKITKIEEE